MIAKSANMPMIKVDRDDYLESQFNKKVSDEKMKSIIELGPVAAGIHRVELLKIANTSIKFDTTKVTAVSFAAGVPGGICYAWNHTSRHTSVLRTCEKIISKTSIFIWISRYI